MESYWTHRTVRHVNSKYPDEPPYLTVHEVYYNETGSPFIVNFNEHSPQSVEDCDLMKEAFARPPAVEVDDSTWNADPESLSPDFKVWKWLEDAPIANEDLRS